MYWRITGGSWRQLGQRSVSCVTVSEGKPAIIRPLLSPDKEPFRAARPAGFYLYKDPVRVRKGQKARFLELGRMAKTWGKNRRTGRFGPADLCLSQTSEPRPPGFRLHFSVRNWTLENRALGVAVGIRTHGGDGPTEVSWCCGGRVGRQT